MRLLRAEDHTFKKFFGSKIPPYVIVSHRWGDEELTHQEFLDGKREGYGWTKIQQSCEIALARNWEWVWIDTICIDKKSSAELTEAINSMHAWYGRAEECYVFLNDVYDTAQCGCPYHDLAELVSTGFGVVRACPHQFEKSSWFARVWALQELLAPRIVRFYDSNFQHIGNKDDLCDQITRCTGIDKKHIKNPFSVPFASVAKRMRWASHRKATRLEDIAYCLLGIFDVNMPLLYGEGNKAFLRLQYEILRTSSDESIFAWGNPMSSISECPKVGIISLLADSPSAFQNGAIENNFLGAQRHYEVTNQGIHFVTQIFGSSLQRERRKHTLLMPLNCSDTSLNDGSPLTADEKHLWRRLFIVVEACYKGRDVFIAQRVGIVALDSVAERRQEAAFLGFDEASKEQWQVYFPQDIITIARLQWSDI